MWYTFIYSTQSTFSLACLHLALLPDSFIHAGPEYWNKLPEQVKTAPSILSFSRRLTQHLIEGYRSDTEA